MDARLLLGAVFLVAGLTYSRAAPTLPAKIVLPEPDEMTGRPVAYTEVVYLSHDGAYLEFTHSIGIARLRIADLPQSVQKLLGYDLETEKKALTEEAIKKHSDAVTEGEQLRLAQERRANRKKAEQARPITFKVIQILRDGTLFGQIWVEQNIGSGLPEQPVAMVPFLTEKIAFFVQGPTGLAEGDSVAAVAYEDGVLARESTDGSERTLRKYVCTQSKILPRH